MDKNKVSRDFVYHKVSISVSSGSVIWNQGAREESKVPRSSKWRERNCNKRNWNKSYSVKTCTKAQRLEGVCNYIFCTYFSFPSFYFDVFTVLSFICSLIFSVSTFSSSNLPCGLHCALLWPWQGPIFDWQFYLQFFAHSFIYYLWPESCVRFGFALWPEIGLWF